MNNAQAPSRSYMIDVKAEVECFFDDTSLEESGTPKAVILMGGVAAGKTYLRKRDYSSGYVLIDAAEIFHHLSRGDSTLDFPDDLLDPLELIGSLATHRALSERRNVVTEVIGAEMEPTRELFDALLGIGYELEGVQVKCDPEVAIERNANRGNNISAYYAEPFQRRWIIEASADIASDLPARP